jgi:hypothetical protein
MPKRYNPLCEVCDYRPKMDRCDCCDECWYSGRYADAVRAAHDPPRTEPFFYAPHFDITGFEI